MPIVRMPDGAQVKFPDSMPPEQIKALIAQKFPQAASGGAQAAKPTGPMINVGGKQISVADYMAMPEAQRTAIKDQIIADNPNTPGMIRPDPLGSFVQGTTFGWGDELRGLTQQAMGGDYNQTVADARAGIEANRRTNPVGAFATEMGGALASPLTVPMGLAAAPASLGARAATGAGIGATQGALYGAGAAEGDMGDRLSSAVTSGAVGGALGAAAPYIGNQVAKIGQRMAQGKAISEAAKNAPSASELKSVASSLFQQADQANPVITRDAFGRLYSSIEQATQKFRPNAGLDPKATGALQVLTSMLDDITKPGSNVLPDLKDIHLLRQAAQRAAVSSEGRDATIAGTIVDKIDEFINSLKSADIAGAANPKSAANALMKGIKTWATASKASIIEEAMFRAQNVASGYENGLRTEFRKIIQNPRLRKQFNEAELQAIRDVANGTAGANLMKILGGIGVAPNNKLMPLLAAGLGGPAGLLGIAGSTIARKSGESLLDKAANRALGAIANGGARVIPPVNPANIPMLESMIRRQSVPLAGQTSPVPLF